MSQIITLLKQIENLNANELAEALEFNGYAECVGAIRTKNIDGQEFLRLTELNISLWRLPTAQSRRLWSFIQQVKQDPKQFLMNIDKPAPKVKPKFVSESKSFILDKPTNISNRFQRPAELTYEDEMLQTENAETNFSTLSKQRSKELKNKLELVFGKEGIDIPNSSFIYNQKQPQLPPKPVHLRLQGTGNPEESKQEEDDFNDGYLSPINRRKSNVLAKENELQSSVNITRSNSTSSSNNLFLNRFRKGYENLEIRPEVIENKYEEQIIKSSRSVAQERPLPSLPKKVENRKASVPNTSYSTEDEDLADYTPILDEDEKSFIRNKDKLNTVTRIESFNRPLPEIPFKKNNESVSLKQSLINKNNVTPINDEELAEYASVLEEEEEKIKTVAPSISKLYNQHRPLPPVPVPVNINERPPLAIPTEGQNFTESSKTPVATSSLLVPSQQTGSVKLKPRAELPKSPNTSSKFSNDLPKPPFNLPMPPLEIMPPDLLLTVENDFPPSIRLDDTHIQQRHSPIFPNLHLEQNQDIPEEIEDSFYTEIDLASIQNYRETDRKGARRLLSGLEEGAFLIRPSRVSEYACTLSIMTSMKMFNIAIQKKSNGTFAFLSVAEDFNQPQLHSVGELIDYYSKTPIYLSGKYYLLKDVLPRSRH